MYNFKYNLISIQYKYSNDQLEIKNDIHHTWQNDIQALSFNIIINGYYNTQ